nr:hypothetical protein Iba_chr03cCG13220 [Ipomoea batatas]
MKLLDMEMLLNLCTEKHSKMSNLEITLFHLVGRSYQFLVQFTWIQTSMPMLCSLILGDGRVMIKHARNSHLLVEGLGPALALNLQRLRLHFSCTTLYKTTGGKWKKVKKPWHIHM